jgi:hypothetical protein
MSVAPYSFTEFVYLRVLIIMAAATAYSRQRDDFYVHTVPKENHDFIQAVLVTLPQHEMLLSSTLEKTEIEAMDVLADIVEALAFKVLGVAPTPTRTSG